MSIFLNIKTQLANQKVTLVAVSKTRPNEAILEKYEQEQRIFGENRVQELVQKYETLPKDIEWHLIGHLQKNKVKFIAPFVKMIHSVESTKLLTEINKQAKKHNRVIDCLLQIKIAQEDSKFGMDEAAVLELLNSEQLSGYQNVRIVGVMGMATFTVDKNQVRTEFKRLKTVFDRLKSTFFVEKTYFKEISMGMSGDYSIAIEEGSTMVRIGSLIFN